MRKSLCRTKQHSVAAARIFEFYLFVHPLGEQSYQCELELLKFIQTAPYKAHVHFIAFHNFQTAARQWNLQEKSLVPLAQRNLLYRHAYEAALAYKSASHQGKRIGRQFLMNLQQKIHVMGIPYSAQLLDEIVTEIGLDRSCFYEDIQSTHMIKNYEQDQRIAHEMNIQTTPSLVIFDNDNKQYGLLINNGITSSNIASICQGASRIWANSFEECTLQKHLKQIDYLQSYY